ncbi:hypothetical protein KI387_002160, partial [Taxus chinensis]
GWERGSVEEWGECGARGCAVVEGAQTSVGEGEGGGVCGGGRMGTAKEKP